VIESWKIWAIIVAALTGPAILMGLLGYVVARGRSGWLVAAMVAGGSLILPVLVVALTWWWLATEKNMHGGDTAGYISGFFFMLAILMLPMGLAGGFVGVRRRREARTRSDRSAARKVSP
jgi:hypothetical protein